MLPFLQAARQRPASEIRALRKTLLRPWMLNSGLAIAISLLALLALETYLYAGLAFPRLLRTRLYTTGTLNFLRDYYLNHDRNIIQALPQCAVYDARLLYTPRPGGCRFSNREFATWLSVNAMGFRQTTQMEGPPRIAVLGDSHAMGWGVEDHETFASLIEQSLGEKVANLSVSSYDTARELIALSRSKLKEVRTIIIAYNHNDAGENTDYFLHGPRQASIDDFRVLQDQQRQPYRPMQLLKTIRPMQLLKTMVHMALENIPTEGPAKWITVAIAAATMALGLFVSLEQAKAKSKTTMPLREEEADQARTRLVAEIAALDRAHEAGEIGPKAYGRIRDVLIDALARIMVTSPA